MKRFLILGCARSGTTLVDVVVSGHPQIASVTDEVSAEAFFGKGLSAFTFGHEPPAERSHAFPALFDAVAGFQSTEATTAIGFKSAIHKTEVASAVLQVVQDHLPDVQVIFVRRKDLVAQAASFVRAQKSGRWHSWNKAKDPDLKVRLEPSQFSNYVIKSTAINDTLGKLAMTHPFLEVSYEDDICQDLAGTSRRIFSFLNLSDLEPTWVNSKKVAPPPESYVTNYAELRALQEKLEAGASPVPPSFLLRCRMMKARAHGVLRRVIG